MFKSHTDFEQKLYQYFKLLYSILVFPKFKKTYSIKKLTYKYIKYNSIYLWNEIHAMFKKKKKLIIFILINVFLFPISVHTSWYINKMSYIKTLKTHSNILTNKYNFQQL